MSRPLRCLYTLRTSRLELYCLLRPGHAGDHAGGRRTWTTEEATFDGGRETVIPITSRRPGHPAFVRDCLQCKTEIVIFVPTALFRATCVVVCPKCKQSALYWFSEEPGVKKYQKGKDERPTTLAEEWHARG